MMDNSMNNSKAQSKKKTLAILFPEIALEWHPTKNGGLTPNDFAPYSNKKVWWKCEKGHEWQAIINNRTGHKQSCPYCAGKKAIAGNNDLQTLNPDLAAEWHPTKNGELNPCNVMPNSNKRVWWLGKCGHEWQATISARSGANGTNCPYCAGQKVMSGFNDLATLSPYLTAQWDIEKNGTISPTTVSGNSNKKVWWKCEKGHEWQATITSRFNGAGCPYCAGQRLLVGINDLATCNPMLAAEWHPTKNGALTPSDVQKSANKKVWWLGKCGHEWQAVINHRNREKGPGCPVCAARQQTSFPEQAVYFYVKQVFPDAINRYRDQAHKISEIDIYIPSVKIGIEYDGLHWHQTKSAKKL